MKSEELAATMGIALGVAGLLLLLGIYYAGLLDTGQFLTDLAIILLTLALTLLLIQTLIGSNERQERNRRASYPLQRIYGTLQTVQERVIREYAKFFRDDDLVHSLTQTKYGDPAEAVGVATSKARESGRKLFADDLVKMVDDIDRLLDLIREDVREAGPNLDTPGFEGLSQKASQLRTSFGPLQGIRQSLRDTHGGAEIPEGESTESLGLVAGFLWAVNSFADSVVGGSIPGSRPGRLELVVELVVRLRRRKR